MKELFILGSGTMARALAQGLRDDYAVCVVGRNATALKNFAAQGFKTLKYSEFSPENKGIILAFKPYALGEVFELLNGGKAACGGGLKGTAKFIISILANKTFSDLQDFKAKNFALAMPNTAAFYKASTTPFICENENFKDEIKAVLNAFGAAFELENPAQMGAAMAISGCAPAFLALVAESIANAGVCEGLKNELSLKLTKSLFSSVCALLQNEHPALVKENVCSPGGVTIKGVRALEQRGVRAAFFEAIAASARK